MAAVTPGKRQPWHRLPEKGAEPPAMEAFRNMYCANYFKGERAQPWTVSRYFCNYCEVWQTWNVSHRTVRVTFLFFPLLVSWEAVAGHLFCFPAVAWSIWQSWNWDTASCWADVCICWYCFWRDGCTEWVVELCLAVSLIPWKLREQWD